MDRRSILSDLTSIDFQKTKRIRLGTSYSFSVGGIGDVHQTAFHFKKYRYNKVRSLIFPEYDLQDLATWNTEHTISGQDLLVSLMNLYDSINRPGISDVPYEEQIMQWCKDHFHPYNYDDIMGQLALTLTECNSQYSYETLNHLSENAHNDYSTHLLQRLLYNSDITEAMSFDPDIFLQDLNKLCDAFSAYLAMAANDHGDTDTIENMIYKGKQYSFPGFLHYFIDQSGRCKEYVSLQEDALMDFADMFPPLTLKLQHSRNDGMTVIAPIVNSVFETCWYALSCMAAAAESEGYRRGRYRFIRCKCCNQLISAYGQQKYCQSPSCQAFRNSQKMQTHRSKKKRLNNKDND